MGSAYFAAALVIPGLIICSLEIFLLGRIYRQRTFPFVLRTLRSRKTSNETAIQFVAPLLLTFAGGISVVLALRMFSMAAPDRGGMSSTLIILATVFMYVLTVMPVLVRCECDPARRTDGSPGGPA